MGSDIYYKLLEIEFRSGAEVEIEPEVIVMRHKGLRGGAAREHRHHGWLDFHKT